MKTEKLVEQRIEKHLDLVEHNKTYYTEAEVLNTSVVLPATIVDGEEKDLPDTLRGKDGFGSTGPYKK